MPTLEEIDPNFKLESNIEREGMTFYDVKEAPFKLHGIIYEDDRYARMPKKDGYAVSGGVGAQATQTAGGRVRFITDSPYIIIKAKIGRSEMCHMPLSGSSGFDMYIKDKDGKEDYIKSFIPPHGNIYDGVCDFSASVERSVVINFPLYGEVCELYIGLKEGSVLKAPEDYKITKPIVYYGSSITQGGCASRPGNAYQAVISRKYDADYLNLGFSGSAKGEAYMAEYIAKMDMSAFVYDYDFNTPTVEHFWATHEPFFKIIREAHPELPVIFMSRPNVKLNPDKDRRHEVIKATYENAVNAGDKNVYIIPGNELMEIAGNDGTVDGTHPNDLGFFSMAKRLMIELDKIFG